MWDLKPFNIYTLCSQEKNYVFNVGFKGLSYIYSMFTRKNLHFSMWDLKHFSIYTLYLKLFRIYIFYVHKKKVIFFQCGIWNPLIYILYVPNKKKLFFQCGIWSPLVYIIYVHKKKSFVFLMWDKKLFKIFF
jgi:hypothetical protein